MCMVWLYYEIIKSYSEIIKSYSEFIDFKVLSKRIIMHIVVY
jgi:hypothetical protein